ncbi:ABC transporter ATP-binding protein [Pseudonocardia nematodicida]|uniref:ABC transporter ATP-binding protein n=1 Tax=Pseudonocardia nematodicida TaxID=1206997 RepID=A0ABV1KGC4_9PSEU
MTAATVDDPAGTAVRVRDLRIRSASGTLVDGLDLDIAPGERVGLIGESGSGKSLTAYALLGLLDDELRAEGDVRLPGLAGNVLDTDERTLSRTRGRVASIVFQEPMTALNPLMRVGAQVAETLLCHGTAPSRAAAARAAVELLDQVRLPDPERAARAFPHQLSGGQRQRVVIAAALANDPALLICDEPTTALDVTVQAQVLEIVAELVRARDTALLFISHDLAVVSAVADRVAVMRGGVVVEQGPVAEVFTGPQHEYTRALLAASDLDGARPEGAAAGPSPAVAAPRPHLALDGGTGDGGTGDGDTGCAVFNPVTGTEPLIRTRGLGREYPGARRGIGRRGEPVHALRDASLDVAEGQKLGIVGESGSGKSTLLRLVAGLDRPTSGTVRVGDVDIPAAGAAREDLRRLRRDVAVVFQDPMGSLDPRMQVSRIVAEPLHGVSRAEAADRSREVLAAVGLDGDALDRYPHQFSGGQRQRISIARALVTRPRILVADEPVSALDVSVRAQVLDLVAGLADEYALTLLFISHDLGVVRHVCDSVLVMASGRIVESGATGAVYADPRHRFTADLVAATPRLRFAPSTTPEESR